MAAGRRGFIERLRTQGGPSLDLLVLLDQHRVLTTDQLARATGTSVRTVRYRLSRLAEHGLVDEHRPGREVGSAPSHWWLRPAGARLVTGTAAAEGRPSHPFVAHTAAIGEAWLAVREHGPAAGIELTGWATDRAGWQEWEPSTLYGPGRLRRLTPDAVLTAYVDDGDVAGEAVAFIEIDLASMTQTQLREKLSRYLAYARDRAWEGVFPHCPPMLLLTTTAARATTYIRAARRTLAAGQERPARFYSHADADLDDADRLMVAACGLVRDPARAVVEAVWLPPEEAAAELTLAELLAERVAVQARASQWRARRAAELAAADRLDALDDAGRRGVPDLTRLLDGDAEAAQALDLLAGDPAGFDDREPELALAVFAWWGTRRRRRRPDGPAPTDLVDALRARHAELWAEHVRAVLAAGAHIAADAPRLAVLAARLQAGRLLGRFDLDRLREAPAADRRVLQAEALAEHAQRRRADVEREHRALGWLARRRTSLEQLATAYDARWLLVCDVCGMVTPRHDPDRGGVWDGAEQGAGCPHCHGGQLIDPAEAAVPTLTERLADLRARLRA